MKPPSSELLLLSVNSWFVVFRKPTWTVYAKHLQMNCDQWSNSCAHVERSVRLRENLWCILCNNHYFFRLCDKCDTFSTSRQHSLHMFIDYVIHVFIYLCDSVNLQSLWHMSRMLINPRLVFVWQCRCATKDRVSWDIVLIIAICTQTCLIVAVYITGFPASVFLCYTLHLPQCFKV